MLELNDSNLKGHPQVLFRKILAKKRNPKVLAIGPGVHPLIDPSLPALAQAVDEKDGELFVVDLQSAKKKLTNDWHGYGDLAEYEKSYKALVKFGLVARKPNFYQNSANHLMFGKETFDLIVDHRFFHYSSYITSGHFLPTLDQVYNAVFAEYLRVLKRNGAILMMLDPSDSYGVGDKKEIAWLDARLKRSMLKHKKIPIVDKYILELDPDFENEMEFSAGEEIQIGFGKFMLVFPESGRDFKGVLFRTGKSSPMSEFLNGKASGKIYVVRYNSRSAIYSTPWHEAKVCYLIRK